MQSVRCDVGLVDVVIYNIYYNVYTRLCSFMCTSN